MTEIKKINKAICEGDFLMNEVYTTELIGLGASLTELAVKGTATAISSKIKAIKNEKNTYYRG